MKKIKLFEIALISILFTCLIKPAYSQNNLDAANPKIEGPDEICRNGVSSIFSVTSNVTKGTFLWESESNEIKIIPDKENTVKVSVRYGCKDDYAKIKVIQTIDGQKYSASHLLKIKGHYYYVPDCRKLFDMGMVEEKDMLQCVNDYSQCIKDIANVGCNSIIEVSKQDKIRQEIELSNSGLVTEETRINGTLQNKLFKLWDETGKPYPDDEYGQPRDILKVAPCMEKWMTSNDFQTLINLAREGMEKKEALNSDMKKLSAKLNADNMEEIAKKIDEIKVKQVSIREEYAIKMNDIAKKETFSYACTKSDGADYYSVNTAKIIGATWYKKGKQPLLTLEISFQFIKIIKATEYGNYYQEIRTFLPALLDKDGNKITKYGLSISHDMINKGIVTTGIKIDVFKKLDKLDFYYSTSMRVKEK